MNRIPLQSREPMSQHKVAALSALFATASLVTLTFALVHRTKLQQENESLRQQVAHLEKLAAKNERLAKLLEQSAPSDLPALRLPAPPLRGSPGAVQLTPDPSDLITRLVQGQDAPRLTGDQIQAYLEQNHRSAASLVAAFRESGDVALLEEALEKYPNDPQVNFAAVFQNASPEQRRERLEAFKQAAPDNAIANYLSAFSYFKAGNADQAVQELSAATSKEKFQAYTLEFLQSSEEAWRAAGYPVAEAKTVAATQLLLPDLTELRQLGCDIVGLASSYRQAGDDSSARAALDMASKLGQRFSDSGGQPLVSVLVGIAIERDALRAMDPAAVYAPGRTVQSRLEELAQQGNALKELARGENLLSTMPERDVISYWDRWRGFGSQQTLQWVQSKYGR